MTTNSDGALPAPGTSADPAVAAQVAGQTTDDEDIDAADLEIAQAAADAEDATAGTPGTAAEPGAIAAQAAPVAPTVVTTDPVMIPKARFDEVNSRATQSATEAAYWRGVAEARGQAQPARPAAPGAVQAQQPTANARLAEIQTAQDALAKRFDDGEITYSDLVKQQRELTNKEQVIREEVLTAKLKPATAANDEPGSDAYSQTVTAQIEDAHPWVGIFETVGSKTQWDSLRNMAFDNLIERKIDPTTKSGVLQLREEVATLMDQLGPNMLAEKAKANGIAIPGQTAASAAAPAGPGKVPTAKPLSPLAQARKAKLDAMETQPPNVGSMSGTVSNPSGVTDAQIETMSEEAYDALPEAARRSLLGIT